MTDRISATTLFASLAGAQIALTFVYSDEDPHAVAFWFQNGNVWTLDREQLAAGLDDATGVGAGDITVRRTKDGVLITLDSPEGHADLLFDHERLTSAVKATEQIVPRGTETVDVDRLLRALATTGNREMP